LRPFKATQVFDASEVLAEAYRSTEDRRGARLLMSARLKLLEEAVKSSNFSAPATAPKPAPKKKKPKPVEAPVVEAAPEPEVKAEPPKPKPKTNELDLNDAAMLLFAATAEEEEAAEQEAAAVATEEPQKPSFDASALDVLGELGGEDEAASGSDSDGQDKEDRPEDTGLEESASIKDEAQSSTKKATSTVFDPSALNVLGELGGGGDYAENEDAGKSEANAKQANAPKASAIDLDDSFAALSDLASMADGDDGETRPDTDGTES
jgi:hypothetical protein